MRDGVVNALTVDFEDWYQGLEIPHTSWSRYEDRIVPATERLLDVLNETGTRATFFVLGYAAERHPALVRTIGAAGHELATHGHSHTLVYRQTPEAFRAELASAVGNLEEVGGQRIIGHRAPFFSITRSSLWAFDVLADLGMRYDSSVFPVRNYRYGIRDAPRWLYEVSIGDRTLLELPISTWNVMGRNLPVGGAYFRLYPYSFTRRAIRSINREQHPAVFYIHPWELDPEHPRIRLPRRISMTHYANLRATEPRLRRLLRDFRFAPIREVIDVAR
jgi:polysaccharide deacetylase family protein (PEP-CTERM system associated)